MSVPFKPGDRVRVKFEGVVVETPYLIPDGCVAVRGDASGIDGDEFLRQVRVSQCTLIEPEIVLPDIPGTIVQVDPLNKCGQRSTWYFESDRLWGPVGHLGRYRTEDLIVNCRAYGYRVIPAAEAEGVSE